MTSDQLTKLRKLAEAINEPWDYYLETGMEGHGALVTYSEDENGMRTLKESVFKKLYDTKPDFELKKMYLAAANPAAILELIGTLEGAVKVIRFYADKTNYNLTDEGRNYTPDYVCYELDEETYADRPLGDRAREFLASMEGGGTK